MTKREKLECSSPGCHIKRMINIQFFKRDGTINEVYFCDKHYIRYIGYMSIHFSRHGYKEEILDGATLYET